MLQKKPQKNIIINWPQIPDIWIGFVLGKANLLFSLIIQQLDIDKIYLYGKGLYKAKFQFLINKTELSGLKHLNDSKTFIEYWNYMNNIYESIEQNNPNKKRKILIGLTI